MKLLRILTITLLFLLTFAVVSYAGEADVIGVEVKKTGEHTYTFIVTVSHTDQGWEHYTDKWDIVAPDDTVLDTRTLHHPHIDEQPFTRSMSGVKIPEGIDSVTIRAHDSVHKYGGKTITITLPH